MREYFDDSNIFNIQTSEKALKREENSSRSTRVIKHVEIPNIHTSYHLYEIILLKSDKENFEKNKSSRDYITRAFSELKKQKRSISKLLDARCKKTAEFFKRDYIPTKNGAGCLLKVEDTKSWGYPNVLYTCAKDFIKKENNFFSICFGKFDVVGIQPVPHSYWSSFLTSFLTSKGDQFSESINIPSLRIKYVAKEKKSKRLDEENYVSYMYENTRVSLKHPFVVITFVKFRKDLFSECNYILKDCEEREKKRTKWKCSRSQNLQKFVYEFHELMNSNCPEAKRTELFLTFSMLYPAVIKAEFENFEEVDKYFKIIRSRGDLFTETSSIFGFNHYYRKTPNRKEFTHRIKDKKGKIKNKNIRFVLLCKVDLQQSTDERVCKKIIDILYRNRIIKRKRDVLSYNSGYYWDIRISFETYKIERLIKIITEEIKCLPGVIRTITYPTWKLSKTSANQYLGIVIQKANMQKQKCAHYPGEHIDFWNWGKGVLYNKWQKINSLFPDFPSYEPLKQKDVLNIRFYDVKLNLEWLMGYCAQLDKTWWLSDAPDILTFQRIKGCMLACLDEFDWMLKLTIASGEYGRKHGFTSEQEIIDSDNSGSFKELFDKFWEAFKYIEILISQIRTTIANLMVEFNERNEGRQIVTVSEPHIRFTERAGLTDLVCGAINSLFKAYCGRPEEELSELVWRGLVSISTGHDFEISLPFHALFLPSDFLCHIYDKLLPLSHEAGHFILGNLPMNSNSFKEFHKNIWQGVYQKAADELSQTMDLLKIPENLEWRFKSIQEYIENQRFRCQFGHSEIFVDMYAGLVGGPQYFHSLARLKFLPSRQYGMNWKYPEVMLRSLLGYKMGQYLNWDNKLWESDLLLKKVEDHNPESNNKIKFFEEDFIEWAQGNDSLADGETQNFFLNPNTYLIKALFREKTFFKKFEEWISRYLHNLFFEDIEPQLAHNICINIAQRISWHSEIVRDRPLKYLAAASVMEPLGRPYYPSGRILLSLFYSDISNLEIRKP